MLKSVKQMSIELILIELKENELFIMKLNLMKLM
jgi:hypothetical protein